MINDNLHKKPVALDRVKHRATRLDTGLRDMNLVKTLNAFFVAGTEFVDACRDYPVVWVAAGKDDAGKAQVAPIAVFGLSAGQNLCVDGDTWRVRYVPAMIRLYPFALARVAPNEMLMVIDEAWAGIGDKGEALFLADGTATEFTANVQKQLEQFETEVERTKLAGALLLEKDLLREMRFDATMPGGNKISVDGFLTVDEAKLAALSDADMLALARNGVLGLIHAHQISLGNMSRLADWHVARMAQAAPAAAAAAPAAIAV